MYREFHIICLGIHPAPVMHTGTPVLSIARITSCIMRCSCITNIHFMWASIAFIDTSLLHTPPFISHAPFSHVHRDYYHTPRCSCHAQLCCYHINNFSCFVSRCSYPMRQRQMLHNAWPLAAQCTFFLFCLQLFFSYGSFISYTLYSYPVHCFS